jgi:hypothetical protein
VGESFEGTGRPRNAFIRLRLSALCRRDVPVTTVRDVIGWWEARRIPFNLIVGSAGVLSSVVMGIVATGSFFLFNSDFGLPDPPLFALFGVVIYGIMANVCFTGGWLVELVIRKLWPGEADRFATLTFTLGLIFSVLLTLTPGIVVGSVGLFGLLGHLLGLPHG